MRPQTHSAVIASAVLSLAVIASADQLMIQGMSAETVTIRDFKDGQLTYTTRRGDQATRDYARLQQISVDGEDALNDAETAFSQGQKDPSVDNYIKAIRGTTRPWVKVFAAKRINDVVGDTGRFDARLAAYLGLLTVDPDAAAKKMPQLPEAGSRYLDEAVMEVEQTLKTPDLPQSQQIGLLNFLVDIHRRRNDTGAVTATLERVAKLSGGMPTDPAVASELAVLKVAQAQQAFDQKDYVGATKLINDTRPMLNDPKVQSDALMILARCALATAEKTDKTALQDAGLAFMRVVAHFNDADGKPNVLPALQQTASILEQTGDKTGAISLLGQIAKEFPNDPAAAAAQQDIDRLKKG